MFWLTAISDWWPKGMQLQALISGLSMARKFNYCNRKLFLESGFVYLKTNTGSCLPFSASHWENKLEREHTWKVTSCFDVGFHHSILTKYLIGNMLFETLYASDGNTSNAANFSRDFHTEILKNVWCPSFVEQLTHSLTYKRGIGIRENMSSDRSRKAWRGIPRKIGLAYLNAPCLFQMAPATLLNMNWFSCLSANVVL